MKNTVFLCFILLLLCSCELNKEFPYTSEEELISLHGLWCPDSSMTIYLSQTLPYPSKETTFPQVANASIALYEDGLYAGDFEFNAGSSRYELSRYPEAGKSYTVEVEVPGYPILKAATSIPEITEAAACYGPLPIVKRRGAIVAWIDFPKITPEDRYWLGAICDYYPFYDVEPDSTTVERMLISPLYTRSAVFDKFNTIHDEGLTSYDFYMRMHATEEEVINRRVDLFSFQTNYFFTYKTMETLSPDLGLYVLVLNGSREFDYYLKSAMLYFVNSNEYSETPNPFAEQITTYSNVENGTGVLAGFNQLLLPLHQNHCQ